jgi:hypothetical protein
MFAAINSFLTPSTGGGIVISTNQTNLNLRTYALANGWNGTSAVEIIINAGVYVYSTTTATPGLTIDGSWPGGVTVTNNGYIAGKGGQGGNGYPANGSVGGSAISLGVNCSIVNNGYIGGGGGGGADAGGGGAGGGNGGDMWVTGTAGGAGGGPGSSGANGVGQAYGKGALYNGGGGGRIFPGTGGAGASSSGGAGYGGGAGGGGPSGGSYAGGTGGSAGNVGGNGVWGYSGGGGGGWGASGGTARGSGGAGGKAIALNGFTATRTGTGTTYGTVA